MLLDFVSLQDLERSSSSLGGLLTVRRRVNESYILLSVCSERHAQVPYDDGKYIGHVEKTNSQIVEGQRRIYDRNVHIAGHSGRSRHSARRVTSIHTFGQGAY